MAPGSPWPKAVGDAAECALQQELGQPGRVDARRGCIYVLILLHRLQLAIVDLQPAAGWWVGGAASMHGSDRASMRCQSPRHPAWPADPPPCAPAAGASRHSCSAPRCLVCLVCASSREARARALTAAAPCATCLCAKIRCHHIARACRGSGHLIASAAIRSAIWGRAERTPPQSKRSSSVRLAHLIGQPALSRVGPLELTAPRLRSLRLVHASCAVRATMGRAGRDQGAATCMLAASKALLGFGAQRNSCLRQSLAHAREHVRRATSRDAWSRM